MAGRHDQAARRRGTRAGRKRGCSIYIPREQLERAGVADTADGGPPYYRTWDGRKGTILVQLYKEP